MRFIQILLFIPCLWLANPASSQTLIDWTILADVTFTSEYNEDYGYSVDVAKFGSKVNEHRSEEVAISGYIIPLDPLGTSYALSRNPNASCFFCGGAGPETVIQLRLKPSALRRYKMDDILTFSGRLVLNERNSDEFTYVLEEAFPLNAGG